MKIWEQLILYQLGYRDNFSKAECYEQGRHVEKNIEHAFELYHRALQQEDVRAYCRIACWHEEHYRLNDAVKYYYEAACRNHLPSFDALRRLAGQENFAAAFFLGQVFEHRQDWPNALNHYEQAAQGGYVEAILYLSMRYQQDTPLVTKDIKKALDRLRTAINKGSQFALDTMYTMSLTDGLAAWYLAEMYQIGEGVLIQAQQEKAIELYKKASALNEPQAHYSLAKLYETGTEELKQDVVQAYSYFALAAVKNHSAATSHLEQLAQAGDPDAQYAFGHDYFRAIGNLSQATHWCVKAELQQHVLAKNYLMNTVFTAEVYVQIARQYQADDTHPSKSEKLFEQFLLKATATGHQDAAFELGQFYQLKKEKNRSFDYYVIAARAGHPAAWAPLERITTDLKPQQQLQLSQLYQFFKNPIKSAQWQEHSELKNAATLKIKERSFS